jgi:hypothetical protein
MKGVKLLKFKNENKKTLNRKKTNKDIEELKDCMKKIVSYFDNKLKRIETILDTIESDVSSIEFAMNDIQNDLSSLEQTIDAIFCVSSKPLKEFPKPAKGEN